MRPRLFATLALVVGGSASAQPTAPRATLVEELRLDANTHDFSVVGRVSVGPRGKIVVTLPQDRQIRLFDSAGKQIAAFGRRGSGPGEFEFLNVLAWVADTLWAYDHAPRRVTFIGPDGKLVRATTAEQPKRMIPAAAADALVEFFTPGAVFGDGAMFGSARHHVSLPGGRSTVSRTLFVRVNAAGDARVVHTPERYEDPRWYMEASGFGQNVPFRLMPQMSIAPSGDRFATMTADLTAPDRGTFTVMLLRTTGDTVFAKTFPFTGTPIPKAAQDSAASSFLPRPGQPTEGPSNLGQQFQAIARQKMPAVYTPMQSIVTGLDGTVWISMRANADGTRQVLALDARGNPMASVLLPPRVVLYQASATHLWATIADEDGLRSVVRYRVVLARVP